MIGAYDSRLALLADEARVRPSHIFHILAALADPAFDPQAFATFARLEVAHIERMIAALEKSGLKPDLARAPKRRAGSTGNPCLHASRLAPIMQLPEDWLTYAQTKRQWDKTTVEDVLADFIEHWTNRNDARAAKIDWTLTWQTWVRRDRRPNGTWQPIALTAEDQRARLVADAEWRRRMGRD